MLILFLCWTCKCHPFNYITLISFRKLPSHTISVYFELFARSTVDLEPMYDSFPAPLLRYSIPLHLHYISFSNPFIIGATKRIFLGRGLRPTEGRQVGQLMAMDSNLQPSG